MSRRLRPLLADHLDRLPCACQGCVFWESAEALPPRCGAACDIVALREWYSTVTSEWGECGRVALEDDEVLGVIKYAPVRYVPQAFNMPAGAPDDSAVLITCMHIRDDARRHGLGSLLLRACLRDLVGRGVKIVQAYGCAADSNMSTQPMIGMGFLLRNGFDIDRPHPTSPLLRMDLRSIAYWTENLESALQALRIPRRAPQPVPTPIVKIKGRE